MPATGKSTYGHLLAKKLRMAFLDTDDLIEEQAGMPCFEVIKQQGNEGFSRLEGKVIEKLDCHNTVIATGGSAVYRKELMRLKPSAIFLHLHASPKTLENRFSCMAERAVVAEDGMSFRDLYAQRMPLYEKISDIDLLTDEQEGSEEQLAQQLMDAIANFRAKLAEHERFMSHALRLAKKAESQGEVPVGALLVLDGEVVGEGWNQMVQNADPTAHAEVQAIRSACETLDNYRLLNTTLYVTLEPCSMCAGALVHARVKTVVFAARDPRSGAAGSVVSILDNLQLNHRCEIIEGVLEVESSTLLKDFFKAKRN